MVLSYSAMAKPDGDEPGYISIASKPGPGPAAAAEASTPAPAPAPAPASSGSPSVAAGAPGPAAGPSAASSSSPGIKNLVLDAGPLLSLAPIRHLASSFYTTPMVMAELRDPKAREHWERLGLSGVDVRVQAPSAEAMAKVTAFARKTGDVAVLSQTDLSVVALTYQLEVAENGDAHIRTEPAKKGVPPPSLSQKQPEETAEETAETAKGDAQEDEDVVVPEPAVEQVTRSIDQVLLEDKQPGESSNEPSPEDSTEFTPAESSSPSSPAGPAEDEESDGGEWITPSNVNKHRSHDLGLLPTGPDSDDSGPIAAACMTGDFACQNVLLGMGLGLVGEGGKRISKVKSFVLRCHACFKLCKDSNKKFCPSCGNPTLMRTTVTVSAKTGAQRIHLKKNYQYNLRGSKYTIPDAKPGRAKGQQKGGTGLILREDQAEWQNAVRSDKIKREKEERKAAKGALDGWNDPDWLPEIITVGMSGKGRSGGGNMPSIGHGRKNPNQARRKR